MLGSHSQFRCAKCAALGYTKKKPSHYESRGPRAPLEVVARKCRFCDKHATAEVAPKVWACADHRKTKGLK